MREGILPRDRDEGFFDLDRLCRFFGNFSSGLVLIGDLASPSEAFKYVARYDRELCHWIKSSFLPNPTCLLSLDEDVLLIADEQLRFSVIGGARDAISLLEMEWGGADALRREFLGYVNGGELGFDRGDEEWALEYLVPWSGWESRTAKAR
jgi:hypothetical protein